MMTTLKIAKRLSFGKRAISKLRHLGLVPGVIYGENKSPTLVEIGVKELKIECGSAAFCGHPIEMQIGDSVEKFIPKMVDFHPVTNDPIHVDFQRISTNTRIKISIAIEFQNEEKSPGIKKGGVINYIVHRLECYCPPDSIPEKLIIDLTGKEIGDSLRLDEIDLPDGISPVNHERDSIIATVVGARIRTADEDATTEEAAS
jgi:large subunit ribosomal protein L25